MLKGKYDGDIYQTDTQKKKQMRKTDGQMDKSDR